MVAIQKRADQIINKIKTSVRFHADFVNEDDNSVTASLKEIDLVVNAPTIEQAKVRLAEDLLEYTEEYFEEFQLYTNSPNRKHHFLYVLAVAMQEDLLGVIKLINA